ncbi:MAG: fused MFS/spermidine synthase [Deltaproteobacteria bacterium]|nr:fused MFS/spermidine synthase [Deltaproteobacteria bacterium]
MPARSVMRWDRALLLSCFFGSGMTSLIYELIWVRRLQLTFGSTSYSITTVLAAFMAGLGIGGFVFGRMIDRKPERAAQLYAYLEIAIGLYALLSLALLSGVEQIYAVVQRSIGLGPKSAMLLKFALAFPVLTFPATLMGGTLPALVRAFVDRRGCLGQRLGQLYGINTIGAAVGTLATGFFLLQYLGYWPSIATAAALNGVIALAVLRRQRSSSPTAAVPPSAKEAPAKMVRLRDHLRRKDVAFAAAALVTSGALSMCYEVVWSRLLALVGGSSSYAFALVLTIFLLGISGGSLLFSRWARQKEADVSQLTLLLGLLAVWATISLALIPRLPAWLLSLTQIPGLSLPRLIAMQGALALALLLVPTLLLGAVFPVAISNITRALGEVGRDVGGAYLANTIGAICGSVITGLLLIPALGTRTTLLVALGLNLVIVAAGVLLFSTSALRRIQGLAALALVVLLAWRMPAWPAHFYDAGLGSRLDQVMVRNERQLQKELFRSPSKLLFLREGVNATISVRRFSSGTSLLINGKADASDSGDMSTQVNLGLIPMLAHPKAKHVGVIGWGSGVTTAVTLQFPRVEQVEAIELEQAVIDASPLFAHVNHGAERDRRVRLVVDDARTHFLVSQRRYDVLISEPSNPWMPGIASLFTQEFYAQAKRRLAPGGVFGQWLQIYRLDAPAVASVIQTLLASFADVQLWMTDAGNMIFLASESPLQFSAARVGKIYDERPALRALAAAYGPGSSPDHFFGSYLLDRDALRRIAKRYESNVLSDGRPNLEYRALSSLYRQTHDHLSAFWSAKMTLDRRLPPLVGPTPDFFVAVEGATQLVRNNRPLAAQILAWASVIDRQQTDRSPRASSRDGGEAAPNIALLRSATRIALRQKDNARALKLAATLVQRSADDSEAHLLYARALVAVDRFEQALSQLDAMGSQRTIAATVYRIIALTGLRRIDQAWRAVGTLFAALDRPPTTDAAARADAQRLTRPLLYRGTLRALLQLSSDKSAAIALLLGRSDEHAGEWDRLNLLMAAQIDTGAAHEAARTLDAIEAYRPMARSHLRRCAAIYQRAGRQRAATRCERLAQQLLISPVHRALWD